jgi:hypothetical protein
MKLRALRRFGLDAFTLAVGVGAFVYVALEWTPSSYAAVFDRLGAPRAGLVFGEPREIREDEWVRWTPFIQAAVRGGFRRTNTTSLYEEDLRNVEGVPLRDWALVLRPYFWPFFLVEPARAFSFYHAFWIASFLIGYHHLLRRFGLRRSEAAAGSVCLFFTSFVQTWWTTYGPVVAGFPWILLVVLSRLPSWLKLVSLAWVTGGWFLGNFYPPIFITLGSLGALSLLALRGRSLLCWDTAACGAGVAIGVGLVTLYFRELIPVMAGTVYPGQRMGGGGGVDRVQWLAQLLPQAVTSGYVPRVAPNVCEASTVGTYLPLLWLCFSDARSVRARLRGATRAARRRRAQILLLGAFIVASSLWILLPLPMELGKLVLWHYVPADRMWFACGLAILLVSLALLRMSIVRLTGRRLVLAALLAAAACLSSSLALGGSAAEAAREWLLLMAPLSIALLLGRRFGRPRTVLIAAAAAANALAFGDFNPIQAAGPIFRTPPSPALPALERLAARHPRGWLVLEGSYGAWLNGLGFRSAAHVLLAPELRRFGSLYPELPEPYFRHLFNRTLYPVPSAQPLPRLIPTSTAILPIDAFEPPMLEVEAVARAGAGLRPRGVVERVEVMRVPDGLRVFATGWAAFDGSDAGSGLRFSTELPVVRAVAYPQLRPEVARATGDPGLALSGFVLRLDLAGAADEARARAVVVAPICLASEDAVRGGFRLVSSRRPDPCRAKAPR